MLVYTLALSILVFNMFANNSRHAVSTPHSTVQAPPFAASHAVPLRGLGRLSVAGHHGKVMAKKLPYRRVCASVYEETQLKRDWFCGS